MDSDPSAAPETAFSASNQSASASGSLPSSYPPENFDIEFSTPKHPIDVDDDDGKRAGFSVNGGGDGGSDNDGFLSGEEEFETPLDRPILVYPNEQTLGKSAEGGGDVVHVPLVNSSEFEFFTPMAERPIAKVSVDEDGDEDEDEDDENGVGESEGGVLRGTKPEQGSESNLNSGEEGLVEKLGSGGANLDYNEEFVRMKSVNNDNVGEMVKESGLSDSHEGLVDGYDGGSDNMGFESGKLNEGVHSVFEGEMAAEKNVTGFDSLKNQEGIKEQNIGFSYDGQQANRTEANGRRGDAFKGNGDSVIDNVQVNLLESGAAVVEDKEEISESGIEGMEPSTGLSHENGLAPIEHDAEEPIDKSVKEQNSGLLYDGQQANLTQADGRGDAFKGDSIVENPQVNLLESGAAVVGDEDKTSESEIKVVEAPADVSQDNGFALIERDTEEPFEKSVKQQSSGLLYDGQQANLTEADGGGDAFKGDSVVETLEVNLLGSGAAVVGDKEEISESEIKDMEAPAGVSLDNGFALIESDAEEVNLLGSGAAVVGVKEEISECGIKGMEAPAGVSLDNGFAPIESDAEEPFDKSVSRDAKSDQNVDVSEDLDSQSHTLGTVMKGVEIDTEAQFEDGKAGSYVEASGRLVERPAEDESEKHPRDGEIDGSVSDEEGDGMIFGSSEAARRFLEELEQHSGAGSHPGADGSQDHSQRIDGQIVTDSDEEADMDEEGDGKELFDSAALAALLKAATGAGQDGGSITITSQDGSRLFSVERPAGLGPSLQSVKSAPRPNHANLFTPSSLRTGADSESNLSEEEKKKLEKLQQIRIKFLRLVQRLGFTPDEPIAAQVLYRMTVFAGRQTGQLFNLDAAKRSASQLEADGKDDLNFSLNILVLGKTGVGKSATINSIFGERMTTIDAYGPATTAVREIIGLVDGVKIKVFDTPGLKSSAAELGYNRKVLNMVKKLTKKCPPDVVLYVDRLDTPARDLNDLPLLRTITNVLGQSIWRSAIVSLTHAASAPPDGPSGSPLSYDVFVAQRSHIVQQTIGQAVGEFRLMNPTSMNPVSLVENHPSCRKNRDGHKVLPNGQSWRPQLLLLCYSMKILSEAGNLSKTQDQFDQRKLFGFRLRAPPLPYLLSSLLLSRAHPKLPADQGGDNGDSDIELVDLSDSDLDEDEDEYDQLPPFKPLRKSQIAKLSREQRKAYLEEYDYRVKLLQKKQWKEELKRMREMKKGKANVAKDYGYMEEDDQENGSPAAVPVPLPDMALPPSFDSDNPAYRYRFLEPTSNLLTRPVLDNNGWDHDCGYDGVNLEHSLAIINKFPGAVTVQVTKDKKDFNIHMDSSVAAKHGENGSTMAGFDIQHIGKSLGYIIKGETKFKIFKRNKTAAGFTVTFLGENVSTGLKVEDQVALGKRLLLVGSTGTVRCQTDAAYGANVEVRLRDADFPISQDQSSLGLSLVKWRGDLALGANFQSQFSVGRSYKMGVRAALNNKLSGQISVKTSSSDQLQIALLAILPVARAIYKNLWPGASENYSIY